MVIRDNDSDSKNAGNPLGSSASEWSSDPSRFLLAAPLDRLASFVIDHVIVLSPIIFVFGAPFERQLKQALLMGNEIEALAAGLTLALMTFSILIIYHSIFTHIVGATVGQLLMGLRTLRVWDQKPLGLWNATLRSVVWFANLMFLGIPTLAVFSDSNRRTWYDRLSDSVVVTIRPRRSLLGPPLYHRSMVQGFFAAIFLFALFVGGNTVISNMRDYSYASRIVEMLEEENVFCRIVGDAQSGWPEEEGQVPSRVSVALGLYFAGDLGLGCLEAEFDSRGFANQEDSLARLAKSLIYSDHAELSDLYLNSVCDTGENASACVVSKSMLSLGEGDYEGFREQLLKVKSDSPIYAKLWAIQELLDMQDYVPAKELVASIPNGEFLTEALVPAEVKLLWGMEGHNPSSGAAQVAFSLLPEDKKGELASWLCYEELSLNCEAWDTVSCRQFGEMVKQDKSLLKSNLASVTYLNKKECEDPRGVNYIGLLASSITPETKDLVKAKLAKSARAYRDLAFDVKASPRLRAEAIVGLLKTSRENEDFLRVQVHWMKQVTGPSFQKVGEALLSYFMESRDYEQAVSVAERLYDSRPQLKRSLLENYVVAEYNLGRIIKAKEILSVYRDEFPVQYISASDESGRTPASEEFNEFKLVVRSLR